MEIDDKVKDIMARWKHDPAFQFDSEFKNTAMRDIDTLLAALKQAEERAEKAEGQRDATIHELDLLNIEYKKQEEQITLLKAEVKELKEWNTELNTKYGDLQKRTIVMLIGKIKEIARLTDAYKKVMAVVSCIAEAPEPQDEDDFIVRNVRRMASWIRCLREENGDLQARLKGVVEIAEYFKDYSQLRDRDYEDEYWDMEKKFEAIKKASEPSEPKEPI